MLIFYGVKMEKNKFTIKDMTEEERPQEKLLHLGPSALTNAELLALIIRTGTKELTSVELCEKILRELKRENNSSLLSGLRIASMDKLTAIKGVGQAKAAMIMAALTLAERLNSSSIYDKKKITSPEDAAKYVMASMRDLETEVFRIIILNTKKEIKYIREISHGIINMTVVHPREVFRQAISDGAHSIILLHNHPTGDPSPSQEDRNLTRRLVEVSKIVGIDICDHIIIGDNTFFSFLKERILY